MVRVCAPPGGSSRVFSLSRCEVCGLVTGGGGLLVLFSFPLFLSLCLGRACRPPSM